MFLKEIYKSSQSFGYMIDNLNIQSATAKKQLNNTELFHDTNVLETEYSKIEKMITIIKENGAVVSNFGVKLCRVRNIDGTLSNINSNNILDDIELFEIKSFCILSNEIRDLYITLDIDVVEIPNLSEIIRILDPDDTKIPSFYIYDSYSPELANIRTQISQAVAHQDRDLEEQLRFEEDNLEDDVRIMLSAKLKNFLSTLQQAIYQVSALDILLAKAQQAYEMGLCRPSIVDNSSPISFKALYNPQIRVVLEKKAQRYQPIDITLFNSPCLITGANMSGKTVLLKTIALSQYLGQFGFFIPASIAQISLVDDVLICMDEEFDELQGLSSYAAEILRINEIIKKIKNGGKYLVLIDELARTTNPSEGRKIVSATLKFLDTYNITGIVTTHYGNITYKTRCLRVKGLSEISSDTILTKDNINNYINYSLVESDSNEVPHEAIRVAEMLGVDTNFIELCRQQV